MALTVEAEVVQRSARVTVAGRAGATFTVSRETAEYGTSEARLGVQIDTPDSWVGYDYELPLDVPVTYLVAVPDSANLVTPNQADVEQDTTGFSNDGNATYARSTAQAAHGSASLAITAVAAGTTAVKTMSGTGARPVVAGKTYTATVSSRAAATARSWNVTIHWYNAAGTFLTQTSKTAPVETTTAWATGTVTGEAPAGAAFASVRVQYLACAAAEVHYADKFGLWEGAGGSWAMPGEPIAIPPARSNPVTLPSGGKDWWVAVANPALSQPVTVESFPSLSYALGHALVQPQASRYPIAVIQARRSGRGVLNLLTLTIDEANSLRRLIEQSPFFYLTGPPDRAYGEGGLYLLAGDVEEQRTTRVAQEPSRRFVIAVTQVDRPPLEVPLPESNTLGDWVVEGTTLAGWRARSFLDVLTEAGVGP